MSLREGSRIGDYRVLEVLGRGGMGVVYEVEDGRGRVLALKVVSRDLAASPEFLARFRREGRAGLQLAHPNVVSCIDAGEVDGSPYIVLEHVSGGTLRDLLRSRGRLEWREAARLTAAIARGLEAVHAAGLVHRDLKPGNVLLDEAGEPKLADFGLVGAHASSLAVTRALTRTGELLGTLAYVAPEQAEGKREVGPAADLYGLGALLYAVLTGSPPFSGTGYELLKKHLVDAPRPPREHVPELPPELDRLVLSLLAKRPDERPASAGAVARELEAIARGGGRRASRRKKAALALALVLLALGATWAWLAFRRGEARRLAASASQHFLEGKYGETISDATRALEIDDSLEEAWARRGEARLLALDEAAASKDEVSAALPDLERALELDPRDEAALRHEGILFERLDRHDDAIACETRALAIDERDTIALAWRGLARFRKGELDAAIADQTRAIELGTSYSLVFMHRGSALSRRGELEAALADMEKAASLLPREAIVFRNRGVLREKLGDREGAIADYTRAVELDPKLALAWADRGAARSIEGEQEAALQDLDRALALDPKMLFAWNNRGSAHALRKENEAAIADFTRAIALAPNDVFAWTNRGSVKSNADDREGALSDWARALELDPRNADALLKRGFSRYRGDDETIADLERFLDLAPKDPNAGKARDLIVAISTDAIAHDRAPARAHRSRGSARAGAGQVEEALADLTRAIELEPGLALAWAERGRLRKSSRDRRELEGALDDLTRAIELDARLGDAWGNRGVLRYERGELDGAIADLTKAVEIDPRDLGAWCVLAQAHEHGYDFEGAVRDYTRAIELDPRNAVLYQARGGNHENMRHHAPAIADETRAIALEPRLAIAWGIRALARENEGDLEGAIRDLDRAIELDPAQGLSYMHRGNMKRKKGERDGAIRDLEKFIELMPLHKLAGTARESIEEMRATSR